VQRIEVAKQILQYRFPAERGKHYGFNITALVDEAERQALWIDTAYEAQAAAAYADLISHGIELKGVIVSHFHPDHVMGLNALPRSALYGSARCEETLSYYTDEERQRFTPTDRVPDGSRLAFGPFELLFRLAPGHSPCSMHTIIGDRFVHVADSIMTSNTGQDILPWAAYDEIQDHIESLEALRDLACRTFLPSHGVALDGRPATSEAIANRVRYLRAVLSGHGRIPYEHAVAECTCDFLHKEWLIRRD
jgi:glyoxylase-like metal-dependent hydrolase (beta-lactamase superfamily II)